ncbi:MAG: zinc/iron-chelating domain-containing protein [Hydrogenophilales bacterium 28-61-23]|nr:MAG: zinc/iron-chelating domain-containing protein [Hydrogenophilales bacterium 28-61-23]
MSSNSLKIRFLRRHIPAFECVPGCHDCCGPVTASSEEMARLPAKSDTEHAAALAALSCPHLGEKGCRVYAERPLICRLFGTTPRLACPNGKHPEAMIDPRIEQRIYRYFATTRQVLV